MTSTLLSSSRASAYNAPSPGQEILCKRLHKSRINLAGLQPGPASPSNIRLEASHGSFSGLSAHYWESISAADATDQTHRQYILQMIPHAEGVQEFWHPSGVRRLLTRDPVVYASLQPPAAFSEPSGFQFHNTALTGLQVLRNLRKSKFAFTAHHSLISVLYGTTQFSNRRNAFAPSNPPPRPRTVPSTVASSFAFSAATREPWDLLK